LSCFLHEREKLLVAVAGPRLRCLLPGDVAVLVFHQGDDADDVLEKPHLPPYG